MTNDPYQQQPSQGGWQPVEPQAQAGQPYPPASANPYAPPSANQPYDQAQPYAQSSQYAPSQAYAPVPQGQASATQPAGQPSATPGWESTGGVPRAGGSYASQPTQPTQDEYTGVVPGMSGLNRPVAPRPPKASPILGALTDLGFTRFGTHALASLAYLAVVVSAVISWLGSVLGAFGAFSRYEGAGDTVHGLASLLLGWIPMLATIVVARILLEVAVSIVDDHTAKKNGTPQG